MEAQHPDSAASSPRSRNTDSWDEPHPPATTATSNKLRLMCSYGGHIVPRPQDKSLCYVGGDTRIVAVDRHTPLSDLTERLSKSFLNGRPFVLKYQLPSEDLDSLVSLTTDEDFENMIDEYDNRTTNSSNSKPIRIRLFLFPAQPDSPQPIGPGPATVKPDDWFLNALNGAGLPDGGLSVNCLLGLDNDEAVAAFNHKVASVQPKNLKQGQDVQSVPDSPMMENNSSFGSTASSPSVATLPPIRVRVEDSVASKVQDQKVMEIEEQFAQLGVGGVGQKQDEGFVANSSPPPAAAATVVSDDEKSEHGVQLEYIKPPTPQPQTQTQVQALPPQFQQKSASAGGLVDLPSPDSVSSDSSFSNARPRPNPVIYQDQVQIQSVTSRVPGTSVDHKLNASDLHGQFLMQQQHVQDSEYVLQQQFDPQQQHVQDPRYVLQQQYDPQQQQHVQDPGFALQQQYDPQQQAQQFMHGSHLIHHTPSGPVPISAYYPVYQQQQLHQFDQQYPVYYVPARQSQAYNMSAQHADVGESATTTIPSSLPQNLQNPAAMVPPSAAYNPMRNAALPKAEAAAGAYRAAAATPQLVQVPASQHQQRYVAYSQIHHPSQPIAPSSAAPANYAYDYADSAYAQMFYAQPLAPSMPSQYQTIVQPEVSAQLPSDSMKQHVRTSQPL